MANPSTYDDANLILRLYELRREEKLRQARDWFGANFKASNLEEMMKIVPQGSQENAYFRMLISYWEMAASFVTSGVLNKELFYESNGELVFVWERIREIVPHFREFMKNPRVWHNLEEVGNAMIERMKTNGPEAYEGFQAIVHGMVAGR